MKRWVRRIILVLSLLVAAATAGFWRSSRGVTLMYRGSGDGYWYCETRPSGIRVGWGRIGQRVANPYGEAVLGTWAYYLLRIPASEVRGLRLDCDSFDAWGTDLLPMRSSFEWGGFSWACIEDVAAIEASVGHLGANFHAVTLRRVGVGYWFVLALCLPGIAWTIWSGWLDWNRRNRARRGQCLQCGYDLRASPERCPECGLARAPQNQSARPITQTQPCAISDR